MSQPVYVRSPKYWKDKQPGVLALSTRYRLIAMVLKHKH